jgi:hypothetical protein
MFKHGLYTNEALKERRLLRQLLRQSRRTLREALPVAGDEKGALSIAPRRKPQRRAS